MRDGWNEVSIDNMRCLIASAAFYKDLLQWHISKHDLYGTYILQVWNSPEDETEPKMVICEVILPDDGMENVINDDERDNNGK